MGTNPGKKKRRDLSVISVRTTKQTGWSRLHLTDCPQAKQSGVDVRPPPLPFYFPGTETRTIPDGLTHSSKNKEPTCDPIPQSHANHPYPSMRSFIPIKRKQRRETKNNNASANHVGQGQCRAIIPNTRNQGGLWTHFAFSSFFNRFFLI